MALQVAVKRVKAAVIVRIAAPFPASVAIVLVRSTAIQLINLEIRNGYKK